MKSVAITALIALSATAAMADRAETPDNTASFEILVEYGDDGAESNVVESTEAPAVVVEAATSVSLESEQTDLGEGKHITNQTLTFDR